MNENREKPARGRGPLALGWRDWLILTLQGVALTSRARRHPHLLSKEGRSLTTGLGGADAVCPELLPCPCLAELGRRKPSLLLRTRNQRRANSCSCLLEPDIGNSFCLPVRLLHALASPLFSLLLCFSPSFGGGGEQGNEMLLSMPLILPHSPTKPSNC